MIKKYLRSIGYCIVVLGVIALSASLGNAQETTTQTPSYVALDNKNFISCLTGAYGSLYDALESTGAYGSLYDALESTDATIATLADGDAKTNLIKRVQYVEAWYYAKCAESRIVAGLMGNQEEVEETFDWYKKAKTRAQDLSVNADDALVTLLGKIHGGIAYEVTVTPQNTIGTFTKTPKTPRAFPVACPALLPDYPYTEFLSGKDMMNTTVAIITNNEGKDAVTFIESGITNQHEDKDVTPQQDTCLFECKVNAKWGTVVVVKENGEEESVDACVGEIRVTACQGNFPANAQEVNDNEVNGNAYYKEQFNIENEEWESIGRSQWTLQDTGDNSAGSCLYTCATGYHPYEGQCVQNMCQQSATTPPPETNHVVGVSEVTTGPEKAWTYLGPTTATPQACEWTCDSGYGRDSATNRCVATTTAQACGGSVGSRGIPSGTTTYVQTLNETFVNGEWVSSYIPTSKDWVYDATGAVSECTWTCPADYPFEYQGSCYSHYHEHDSANQILEKQAQSGPQSGQNHWHMIEATQLSASQYCGEATGTANNGTIAETLFARGENVVYWDSGWKRFTGADKSATKNVITKLYCH